MRRCRKMVVKSSLGSIFPPSSRPLENVLQLGNDYWHRVVWPRWWQKKGLTTFYLTQLNFEDVLAEPDVAHGFDPIWRSAFILFTGSRFWIYRLLSAFLALPLALVWGITFSLITFFSVWFATPVLRIMDVFLFFIRRVISFDYYPLINWSK